MKRIYLVLFLVLTSFAFGQTAKEIISKNIVLTGGLTNWKLLNSVSLQGKLILGIKDEYPIKIFQERPNLTKTSIVIGKKETAIEGYDGKKGYAMNYTINKMETYNEYNPESFDNDFIDFENKGFTAQLLGKENVGQNVCYKVQLTKNVNKTVYYFDVKSYMLLKEVKKDETLVYSDYKKVGNLMFAFKIEGTSPAKDQDFVMLINKIETNKVFPNGTFKF